MLFKVTFHLQKPKESFIWQKLKSDILPKVSKKKKSSKVSDLFRLKYFQLKVKKSGRCQSRKWPSTLS